MREIIISERLKGKTTALIEKCNRDRYSLIVCPNKHMCHATFKMALEINKPIPMPITFKEFATGQYCAPHIEKFYFDELQMSLASISRGVPIDTVVIDVSHSRVTDWREE